jgi:hypothetical protein
MPSGDACLPASFARSDTDEGLSEPVSIYEVTGLGPLRTRLQRAVGRGLSKFVGRQAQMETLKRALEGAGRPRTARSRDGRAGGGQVTPVL